MKKLKRAKGWLFVVGVVFILLTFATIHFIYILSQFSNVEDTLRLVVSIVVGIIYLVLTFKLYQSLLKRKIKRYLKICFTTIIYSAIILIISTTLGTALSKLGNFTTNKTVYSASIVTLKENKAKSIKDISKKDPIGRVKDKTSVDGYQIPNQIIKDKKLKNKIKSYENYTKMIDALLDGKIDYIFLPTNYVVMFKNIDAYKDLGDTTKIIYTQKKEIVNKSKAGKKLTEPFTVLLMGVDSEQEDISNSSYNGDSLMLITFNPKTLNTTILSIPRDTYVPIACFSNQRKNKITHAAWYGENCMMDTISGFTNVDIDYFVKINFKGVVKLVDTLGGIDVDVPIGFCEQDSNRNFKNLQCLDAGKQKINGEQALAWARHRKSAGFDDFVRGQNQQEVVKGILNKLKDVKSLNKFYKILDALGTSMETNMSRDEILSLYNVGKDVFTQSKDMKMEDLFSMQRLYISGYDQYIYDYSQLDGSGTGLSLYNFVPYKKSLKEISQAMKINLGLAKYEMVKEFSFDINNEYKETVIGKGEYSGTSVDLLPNFVGYDKSEAMAWGSSHGVAINVKEVDGSVLGRITEQSLPEGMDVDYVRSLTIYVVAKETEVEEEEETTKPEPKDEEDDNGENTEPQDEIEVEPSPTPTPTPTPEETPDITNGGA